MKFGKEFSIHLERTLPAWREKYLKYKQLKKLLNNITVAAAPLVPLPELLLWFIAVLCVELEKFNDFYVEKEELFVIRFEALRERVEAYMADASPEFSRETMELRQECVSIHGEMVLLKSYSTLNFVGLVKISKKFDKRTGTWLSLPFIRRAYQQPFFATETITGLISECEDILDVLFPLEDEVIEEEQTGNTNNEVPTGWLGEATVEIYQSTIAALSAIEGITGESSTHNPLSMTNLFRNNNGNGGVTAENSPHNSP